MNENAETKICPFCAETIKALAKQCPFCNSRLVKFAVFRQEFIFGISFLLCFGWFVLLCVWVWPDDSGYMGRRFALHRGELEIKNVRAIVKQEGTNEFYYNVTGIVTNKGENPWRVQQLELTITNSEGAVDVTHTSPSASFVVQPHTEHEFLLHAWTRLTNTVVAAKARVDTARDGNMPSD